MFICIGSHTTMSKTSFCCLTVFLYFAAKYADCLLCENDSTQWFCPNSTTDTALQSKLTNSKSCFCVGMRYQTQTQADAYCQVHGGYLTDIENDEENLLIQQLLQLASDTQYMNACSTCIETEYHYNHSCYYYVDGKTLAYDAAETYCQKNFGGHLVSIHNAQQLAFVWNVAKNCSACVDSMGLHIGADHFGQTVLKAGDVTSTKWIWQDGTPFDYYMPITKDPTLDMKVSAFEQCSSLAKLDGGWQDYACISNADLNFVCEYSVNFFPAWISLTKSSSATYSWKVGFPNCGQVVNSNYTTNVVNKAAAATSFYAIDATGKWVDKLATDSVLGYVCRKDIPNDDTTQRLPTANMTSFSCLIPSSSNWNYTCGGVVKFRQMGCGKSMTRDAGVVKESLAGLTINDCTQTCLNRTWCLAVNYNPDITISNCELLTTINGTLAADCGWNAYKKMY